jgi:hypothetical protein
VLTTAAISSSISRAIPFGLVVKIITLVICLYMVHARTEISSLCSPLQGSSLLNLFFSSIECVVQSHCSRLDRDIRTSSLGRPNCAKYPGPRFIALRTSRLDQVQVPNGQLLRVDSCQLSFIKVKVKAQVLPVCLSLFLFACNALQPLYSLL